MPKLNITWNTHEHWKATSAKSADTVRNVVSNLGLVQHARTGESFLPCLILAGCKDK